MHPDRSDRTPPRGGAELSAGSAPRTAARAVTGASRSARRGGWQALTVLLALALTLPVGASAQRLPTLLPADTVVALGVVGLEEHAALLDGVLADWERFGVGPALERALGGFDGGALGLPSTPTGADDLELPPGLEGLELLDVLGREAWVGVSISPFNPLPSVTLLALVDDAVAERFATLIGDTYDEPGARRLREGDTEFVAVIVDGLPLAAARRGELLALSSNPDTLRFVLRAAQGGGEASFGSSAGYAASLGTLAPGQLYGYLDLDPVARALAPRASGLGFDRSVARLSAALETVGVSAGVMRVTPDGSASESVQLPRGDGRDAALFRLLTATGTAPERLLAAVPAEAVSISVSAGDASAGFEYLMQLLSELPELALPDPAGLLRDFVGLDLRRDVFSWAEPGWMSVTTGFGATVDPGIPADDLLGESALVLLSRDDAAARTGLERSAGAVASLVSAFADPMGMGGVVQPLRRQVAGVEIAHFDVFPGLELHVAAANGFALIATSHGAADAVAQAIGMGAQPGATIARLLPAVPASAGRFSVSDDRATLLGSADQLTQQVQLIAGLSGGTGLDFDAVEAATEALEGFLSALAERLGGSVSYGVVDGAVLRGVSRSEIDWR